MADYDLPDELRYTAEDEWVRAEDEHVVIGVTDYAQNQLGDIVFVELPEVGAEIEAGTPYGTIESVKAVSDLVAPISGAVLTINENIEDQPELVNEACYGEGWLITVRPSDSDEVDGLLDNQGYRTSIADRES